MFETLGLDDRSVDVYRTLLSAPAVSLERLAESTGLEMPELHEVLTLLEAKGFLRRSHTDPGQLRTESPLVAFERLVSVHEAELHRTQERLSAVRASAAELVDEYHASLEAHRLDRVEHIVDTDEIVARLRELSQNAATSVDSLITFTPTSHMLGQARSDELPMLARGVRLRTIYPAAARYDDDVIQYAQWFQQNGGAARTVLHVPNRVLIYDAEAAVVMFDHEDFAKGAIVLSAPGAVLALHALFTLLWDSGTDLVETCTEAELRPEERELLQLLGRGMKDEAVARTLGVSIRTVRRMITSLSEQLDAPSRFALGARASERGLL